MIPIQKEDEIENGQQMKQRSIEHNLMPNAKNVQEIEKCNQIINRH